ncbi:Crp/Fnr family transcriptional regulator [Clostridium uliginosum]|uniref:CRP/FNR family transcriptional regulator, anaerobic regulatory protein n=1 Tax=Clostridium uliginosum TaxID=119641 RepID=A0A1I1PR84_9CLOT|nr:Crp/Fnr family transcriptional regulator [Clostridium uliginosum]SFD12245.1 CRP/FNR family transcriptional regulator, anaerobic regulatory protein [Clostridium uliginosum]
MKGNRKILNSKANSIENLYNVYPILKNINEKNNGIITKQGLFKMIYTNEYISSSNETCIGILFVIKGTIKIQKINKEGEETNLYNIKQGELCHEALSCLLNFESLNIIGRAIQDSEICIIPMDVIKNYFFQDNKFLSYMYKDLYKKFSFVIENKEERVHESLETRLLKLLINKDSKIIYATHNELAFEIDSAREAISRKLKSIEKRGYIKLERGKIQIIKNLEDLL